MSAKIQLLSNLNYPIGNIVNQELRAADKVQIAVAFMKYSAIEVIQESMSECLKNGGSVEIITGLDFKTTDPKSIHHFVKLDRQYPAVKFYCFGDKRQNKTEIVFHPKMYLFEAEKETTGIVGSTNLTKGGLTSNFEVNTIFKETKPHYFAQLQAIYNSVKFTDSVFSPDEDYLAGYSDVYGAFLKNEGQAAKDKGLQKIMADMQDKEEELPGTVPPINRMIISAIESKQSPGNEFVPLAEIYKEVEKTVNAGKAMKLKPDTLNNSIRGELNRHEAESKNPRSKRLFARSKEKQGCYSLTDKGRDFQGR